MASLPLTTYIGSDYYDDGILEPPWDIRTAGGRQRATAMSMQSFTAGAILVNTSVAVWGHLNKHYTTPNLTGVVQLAASDLLACVLLDTGKVECWYVKPGREGGRQRVKKRKQRNKFE